MFSEMFKIRSPLQRRSLVGRSHLAIFLKWVELLMCEVLGEVFQKFKGTFSV